MDHSRIYTHADLMAAAAAATDDFNYDDFDDLIRINDGFSQPEFQADAYRKALTSMQSAVGMILDQRA